MREFNLTALISGVVFIVLGSLFLLDRLDVLTVSSRFVWPVVLVAIGVAIIAGGGRRHHDHGRHDHDRHDHDRHDHDRHDHDRDDRPPAI